MIDPLITAIDDALTERSLPRAALGRKLGLDSKQINRLFNGERKLQHHEARIAQEWLWPSSNPPAGGAVIPMPGMVPLYGWVGASSDASLVIAEQNLRGYVPMHPNQMHVREPFALEVADISMIPRYEPGEIIYLAPHRWPARGQDCVLVTTASHGLLKRFVRRDPEQIVLHQLNPERELTFPNAEVESVHAVVGRG